MCFGVEALPTQFSKKNKKYWVLVFCSPSNVVDFGDLVLGNGKCEFNHEGVVFEVGIEDVDDSDINVITVIGFLMFTLGERKNLHIIASLCLNFVSVMN